MKYRDPDCIAPRGGVLVSGRRAERPFDWITRLYLQHVVEARERYHQRWLASGYSDREAHRQFVAAFTEAGRVGRSLNRR